MDVVCEVKDGYLNKFRNKLYGLLCEREKNGEWEKYLDNLLIELNGFPDKDKTINYLILYYKLSSCKYLEYKYFRNTIFECMNLISKVNK